MNNSGFIFLLSLGASLLAGIVAVAHVSAHRLSKRLAGRHAKAVDAEPELDLGDVRKGYAIKAHLPMVVHADVGSRF